MHWLTDVARQAPGLFAHWRFGCLTAWDLDTRIGSLLKMVSCDGGAVCTGDLYEAFVLSSAAASSALGGSGSVRVGEDRFSHRGRIHARVLPTHGAFERATVEEVEPLLGLVAVLFARDLAPRRARRVRQARPRRRSWLRPDRGAARHPRQQRLRSRRGGISALRRGRTDPRPRQRRPRPVVGAPHSAHVVAVHRRPEGDHGPRPVPIPPRRQRTRSRPGLHPTHRGAGGLAARAGPMTGRRPVASHSDGAGPTRRERAA